MIDSDYDTLKERIHTLIQEWKERLWLRHWSIDITYERNGISPESHTYGAVASTHTLWEYMSATITIDMPRFSLYSPEEQEEILVHEFMHVMVGEMRDGMQCEHGGERWNMKHEERVCTLLTHAIIDLYGQGEREKKEEKKEKEHENPI